MHTSLQHLILIFKTLLSIKLANKCILNLETENWNELGYYDVENMGLASSRLMTRTSNSPVVLEPKTDNSGDIAWPTSSSPIAMGSTVASGGSNDSLSRERGLFPDWNSLASSGVQAGRRSVGNVSEIWEPATLGSTHDAAAKWPTTFETPTSDSAIGSGSRPSNQRLGDGLGELGGFRATASRNSDVPQNHHREVEVCTRFISEKKN